MCENSDASERKKKAEYWGFAAGLILLTANLPLMLQQYLSSSSLTLGEMSSRAAMLAGQVLWIIAGLYGRHVAVVVMCSIQVAFLSGILAIAALS